MKYIKNGEIYISEEDWKNLNLQNTKSEIIDLISDLIDKVEPPYRKITLEEAQKDYLDLSKLPIESLIKQGSIFTKYEYNYDLSDTYIDLSVVGNKSSDYFHQESRFKCDSITAPSPYRVWTTEKFRKNLLKNLWTMPTKKVDSSRLRTALSLRGYTASQFRPSAAKVLYELFDAKNVLDFSSGWGDRLAGFFSASKTKNYTGYDPNSLLTEGYKKQIEFYSSFSKNKSASIHCLPAEEMSTDGSYDFIFSSCPYFDLERYSQEDTQSWKRYKKLDNWLENFLFEVIKRSWCQLEVGGFMAINVADVYCHHTVNQICDPMNGFISTLPNASYKGAIGYRMAKRPNSGSVKNGLSSSQYVEPIWIWKKD